MSIRAFVAIKLLAIEGDILNLERKYPNEKPPEYEELLKQKEAAEYVLEHT